MGDNVSKDLLANVEAANRLLLEWEETHPKCVSKEDRMGFIGYNVQFVIDAVNAAFGVDAWRYEAEDISVVAGEKSVKVITKLILSFRRGEEWFSKGPVYGGSVNMDEADARKGAISDAIKKAFAAWSIGNRAMRGELDEQNGKKGASKGATRPPAKPGVTGAGPADDRNLAEIRQEVKLAFASLEKSGVSAKDLLGLREEVLGQRVKIDQAPLDKLQALNVRLTNYAMSLVEGVKA